MSKVIPICNSCESSNIVADCLADWDIQTQKWIAMNPYDKGFYCQDCEIDTRVNWLNLEDYLKTEQGKNDDYANSIGK